MSGAAGHPSGTVAFELDGAAVVVEGDGTLLGALREQLGRRATKDGCSPQGQCGCCTVWVDGAPRVACVTPVRRVAGRSVTTVDGLEPDARSRWAGAFVAAGASQCGFCTPGIIMRLAGLARRRPAPDGADVRTALLAHLCRCTGWQSIVDAALLATRDGPDGLVSAPGTRDEQTVRDPEPCRRRARLEGPASQISDTATVLGGGGFADDTAPADALVAVPAAAGGYVVAPTVVEARRLSGQVPGRNSSAPLRHPVAVPEGDWRLTLRTTWIEPAYLEPDASWCVPGGQPATPLANGGAFGGKRRSPVGTVARELADRHGQPVRVLWSREDVVRQGPKRPPVAAAIRDDGSGCMRVGITPGSPDPSGLLERVRAANPLLAVELVEVPGPIVSPDLRGAGWLEAAVVTAAFGALSDGRAGPGTEVEVVGLTGGRARAAVTEGGVHVAVWAGEVLDEVTLRSFCYGAAHQALGMVWSEGIAVDQEGRVQDLTVRSFGVLSARETPPLSVEVHPEKRTPVNGSDAVLAAVAAAAWLAEGLPGTWPTRRGAAPGVVGAGRSPA